MQKNVKLKAQCKNMETFIECPHCSIYIEIIELNCKIFRCGILKENGQQINPHLSKKECDQLVQHDLIYGCGKPFQLIKNADNSFNAVICDYV